MSTLLATLLDRTELNKHSIIWWFLTELLVKESEICTFDRTKTHQYDENNSLQNDRSEVGRIEVPQFEETLFCATRENPKRGLLVEWKQWWWWIV